MSRLGSRASHLSHRLLEYKRGLLLETILASTSCYLAGGFS
jgi:hypothetical protein